MTARFDLDALKAFVQKLPSHGHVLSLGPTGSEENLYLMHHGFRVEAKDSQSTSGFMLLSMPKESFDAAWVHQVLNEIPKDLCQRLMGSLFAALKPKGILFASAELGSGTLVEMKLDDIASLIRQSGFQILSQGRSLEGQKVGFIAKRV